MIDFYGINLSTHEQIIAETQGMHRSSAVIYGAVSCAK